jgi:hypothetical protein
MQLARSASAVQPRRFGCGRIWDVAPAEPAEPAARHVGDDLKLFVTTFAAGFIFVSVFLA